LERLLGHTKKDERNSPGGRIALLLSTLREAPSLLPKQEVPHLESKISCLLLKQELPHLLSRKEEVPSLLSRKEDSSNAKRSIVEMQIKLPK